MRYVKLFIAIKLESITMTRAIETRKTEGRPQDKRLR
jgi:hypothetical protein